MIELRNYKRMHVYRAHARSSIKAHAYRSIWPSQSGGGGGGGRVYEIRTLRSNLAPEEGGAFIPGGRTIKQVRYIRCCEGMAHQ